MGDMNPVFLVFAVALLSLLGVMLVCVWVVQKH